MGLLREGYHGVGGSSETPICRLVAEVLSLGQIGGTLAMDAERMRQIEELYHAAREREPVERAAFLRGACGDNEELRSEVESLLAQDSRSGPLDRPAWGLAGSRGTTEFKESAETAGMVIDRYHLLQKIGEGGMGEVWLAEQKEPVRRRLALKLVKAGMNTREVIARFESERQALAR